MQAIEVDGFTVQGLVDRYTIDRSSLYKRINGLKNLGYAMTPASESGKSIYSLQQVTTLDALHKHLNFAGNKISDFPRIGAPSDSLTRQSYATVLRDSRASSMLVPDPASSPSIVELVQAIAQSIHPPDPLANLEALERAAAHGWLLSTSQLKTLIGAVPGGDRFSRYGYNFERAGKNGRETAWRIAKVSAPGMPITLSELH
jgi:hypothetical protein